MSAEERIVCGLWTWVGDWIIGHEAERARFVAIHKSGQQQITQGYGERSGRCSAEMDAAKEIVRRVRGSP